MAETSKNSAGEIAVDITGNTDPLKKKLAEMKSESEAAAKQVGAKGVGEGLKETNKEASTLGIKFAQLKVGMLAIAGAAKQLWDGIKGAAAATEDFGRSMRSVEQAFRTDIEDNLDALGKRRAEIIRIAQSQKDALDAEIRQRSIIQDLVAFATNDAAAQAVRQKIDTETDLAMKRVGMIKKQDLDRLAASAQEELRLGNARINLARNRAEDEAAARVQAEIEANRIIEEDKRRRGLETQAELMRMQQAQFAQLRNDINGLFNTSGLEVGINRIGALIETLIQKTGDSR